MQSIDQAVPGTASETFSRELRYLILLLALGAQTLVVELTIPRLIAPVFGNTLFSWTAIIAVVLVALTVGYRWGGKLASRVVGPRWIAALSLLAALWVIGLSVTGEWMTTGLSFLNLMFGPLAASLLLAAVPAFLDAAVVPLVIQQRPEEPGEASGICFAWSTVGSIIGVLATGYILLPQLGISGALLTGAVMVLVSLGLLGRIGFAATGITLALIAAYVAHSRPSGYLVDMSNGYHRIRVTQHDDGVRRLYLDSTLEGAVKPGSAEPVVAYQRKLTDILRAYQPASSLFLGGGAFTLPRMAKEMYPDSRVEVVEIDPDVVRVGEEYLELGDDIVTLIGDGRRVLKALEGRYDLIVNDAFQGLRRIPFHMTTREFHSEVANKLAPAGVYAINVRGDPRHSALAASIVRTLAPHFKELKSLRAGPSNAWVIASQVPIELGDQIDLPASFGDVLTDNHAPIEYLVVRDLVMQKLGAPLP